MPTFKYTATDKNNQDITAVMESNSRDELAGYLHAQGLTVISIEEKLGLDFKSISQIQIGGHSLKNRLMITKQLLGMLQAGLPITQAMNVLKDQAPTQSMKKEIIAVYRDLQNGTSLSQSFSKNTKIYNKVQINLIAAGEKSGNLVEILSKVQEDMSKANVLRNKIRGAMIYPAIIFIAIGAVVLVLVFFMVPQMETLYNDFGIAELPFITNLVVKFANFIGSIYGLIFIMVMLAGIAGASYYYRSTQSGKRLFHKIFLKVPVFGKLNEMIQVAEFARLLSLLLNSGVPIIDALNIVADSTSNLIFAEVVRESASRVSKGVPLAVPLTKSEIFPSIFTKVVTVGEETGKLDQVLSDMAKFYDEEVTSIADNLTKLMEPFILLIVGLLVAFLAIAVYWPIYSLGGQI